MGTAQEEHRQGRQLRSLQVERLSDFLPVALHPGGVGPGTFGAWVAAAHTHPGKPVTVQELDPWSRIPERRHALLRFEP